MYRELMAMGAKPDVARQVAANSRCWWRNSGQALNTVLTLTWSDQLGLPVSHDLNFSNRPVRTRMPGGVAGVRPTRSPPMPILLGIVQDRLEQCPPTISGLSGCASHNAHLGFGHSDLRFS